MILAWAALRSCDKRHRTIKHFSSALTNMHFPAKLKHRIEPPLRIHRGANPLLNTKKVQAAACTPSRTKETSVILEHRRRCGESAVKLQYYADLTARQSLYLRCRIPDKTVFSVPKIQ